jgi:hypothetical protein
MQKESERFDAMDANAGLSGRQIPQRVADVPEQRQGSGGDVLRAIIDEAELLEGGGLLHRIIYYAAGRAING